MKKYTLFAIIFFSIFSFVNAQNNWKPFAGLHVSASNDLYYVGPSFSGGIIHAFGKKKKWNWVPEVQYFRQYEKYDDNGTSHSWDKFVSFSIRSNFNYTIGKNLRKGMFIGGGLGFQKAKDECATVTQDGITKKENIHFDAIRFGAFMLTFNAGYRFPIKKNKSLEAIISIIGPQTAKDYLGTYVEGVSLMSAGMRVIL